MRSMACCRLAKSAERSEGESIKDILIVSFLAVQIYKFYTFAFSIFGKIAVAEKKAAAVIEEAGKKADDVLRNSKAEIERLEKASEDAVTQACRNMLLRFRESLVSELDAFVRSECAKAYSSDMLKSLVPETVKAWCKNTDASELSVLLSEKDCKELEGEFKAALKAELSKGMVLKADRSLASGFRIGVSNGAAYYDYSAEAIADLFTAYLNPRVAAIMKSAAKGTD